MSQSHVTHLHKPADDPRPVTHESRKILTYPKNWSIPIIRLKALTFMTHRSENLKKWQNLEQVPSLLLKRLANDPRPVAQESQNLNQPPKASKSQKGVRPFSTIFSIFLWLSIISHKISRQKKLDRNMEYKFLLELVTNASQICRNPRRHWEACHAHAAKSK